MKKITSFQSEINLPIVTCALTHGITVIGYLFVDLGDKVFVTDKFWGKL